jgi:hypothetical protein
MRRRFLIVALCGLLLPLLHASRAEASTVFKCIGFLSIEATDSVAWVHNDGNQAADINVQWLDALGNPLIGGPATLQPGETVPFIPFPENPAVRVVKITSTHKHLLVDAETLAFDGVARRHVHCFETAERRIIGVIRPPR